MESKKVRIGGGSGFWGDSAEGPRQLILQGSIDYLAMDYMAEVTMSIFARIREKQPAMGYATDFVSDVVQPLAAEIKARGVKVICNAGGVNPVACAQAVRAELARQGIALKVAAITGDDLMPQLDAHRQAGLREMATGAEIPDLITANAYTGAFPIAEALGLGADIVITGRCADSALALGPLIHEYGWRAGDLDQLASGSLAGHVIECGPQSTGGFFTDWRQVADGWENIGYPIVECDADGNFVVCKAPGTGGLVSFGTVAEQITYETGDPSQYLLPDVVCDLRNVSVREIGPDQVAVRNIKGLPPTPFYKVNGTYQDGFRSLATLLVRGREATDKSRAVAGAILRRTSAAFSRQGLAAYSETSVELLGAEEAYAVPADVERREIMLKIAVRHPERKALEIFAKEIYPASTGTVQGVGGVFGGRPKIQPMVRLFSFLVPKECVKMRIEIDGVERAFDAPTTRLEVSRSIVSPLASNDGDENIETDELTTVPLEAIAFCRSGDKGDISNIAVIARQPEFKRVVTEQVTEQAVARVMKKLAKGPVYRFNWPGVHGFNFLLEQALGGGGVASLRYDPQGKSHGQILADMRVEVPLAWLQEGLIDARYAAEAQPSRRQVAQHATTEA